MKKRIFLALMLAAALFALAACSATDKAVQPTATTEAPATEAPATEAPTAEPTEAPAAEPTEAPAEEPAEEADEEAAETEALTIGGAEGATQIVVADAEEAETAEAADEAEETEAVEVADEAEETEAIEVAEEEAAPDPILATAYNGDIVVRVSDAQSEYDSMLASYIDMYAQYGYQMDEYDPDLQASVAQEVVQMELSKRIIDRNATDAGYVLTEERDAELTAQAESILEEIRTSYESYLTMYGYEGEELQSIIEEELNANGYTLEALLENAHLSDMLDYLYNLATADVTVTDEEVQAAFDAKLEQAQEKYADVDAFISDYLSGAEILCTPEGVRLIQCIYFVPSEEDLAKLALAEEDADEATPAEAKAVEETPAEETAGDVADLTGSAKANAVLALIRDGMDFTEAMTAYNEDGSTPEEMEKGYPVSAGSTIYADAFTNAAMALAQPGDVSDVLIDASGCFILRYASDLEAGAVTLESRMQAETEEALQAKQTEAYNAYIDKMLEDADFVFEDFSPLYHVFVAEQVEMTIAYGQLAEETALTDVPAGEAVATLAAGASVDVLGHIELDATAYAFVSVPGTDAQGYLPADAFTAMDEDDALAVDNAALLTMTDPADKKPIFTIVMNDGSVIYGELYPEIAPETVGNFVSLANDNFYDNLTFHRVIPGFMIQGGDPNGDGTGGPGYAIKGEFTSNGVENTLSHTRGVLSMARSAAANSGGSQFFIMHADGDYLDGEYAAFGQVLGGLETVDVIASTPTNSSDRPMTEQTMRTVYVETFGQNYDFTKLSD